MKEIDKYGTILYYDEDKILHREDGPAVESSSGTKVWSKVWYRHGKYHRNDGPAIERSNGDKAWYRHGKLHRTDGPAIELSNGSVQYWVNGVKWEYLPSSEEILTRDIIE